MGVPEMTQLAATAKVTPAVNQIELHPWLQWKHVTDYCKEHRIVLEVGPLSSPESWHLLFLCYQCVSTQDPEA